MLQANFAPPPATGVTSLPQINVALPPPPIPDVTFNYTDVWHVLNKPENRKPNANLQGKLEDIGLTECSQLEYLEEKTNSLQS